MTVQAAMLPGGRLHLNHGPIDLIIGAEGDKNVAFGAAQDRFSGVLGQLMTEISALRQPMTGATPMPSGAIARRMHRAVIPHSGGFVTRMAAVAGAVADEILAAMCDRAELTRAYVNNGGDIALHLGSGERFTLAMQDHRGQDLGRIAVTARDGIGGIASSGRHGRSLSFGIADSVTVLARCAADADAAATLIANAVDLPGHPKIQRQPACDLDPDSDLGARLVTTACAPLTGAEVDTALDRGLARARGMPQVRAAALFLQGQARIFGSMIQPLQPA